MLKLKIKKSLEESQTTDSSTIGSTTNSSGSSTRSVEPFQRNIKPWKQHEIDLLTDPDSKTAYKLRRQLFKKYWLVTGSKNLEKKKIAQEYFDQNFPGRSVVSVFQKAWRIHRRKGKKKLPKK